MTILAPQTAASAPGIWQSIRERQGTFVVGSWITVILNGTSVALYGIGSILVARILGPSETGLLAWFTAGTATFSMFADVLGVYYSNAYLTARKGLPYSASSIRGTVLAYGGIVGLTAGLLFAWVPPVYRLSFPGFFEPVWSYLVFFNLIGLVLVNQIRGLYWGNRSFLLLGLLSLIKSGGYALVAVVCVYALGWRRGSQVALAQVSATWACVGGSLLYFLKRGMARPQPGYLRMCMQVGWRGAGVNWLSFLHQRVDQYLVNFLLGPLALGLYAVAVSLGELITQIPGMLGMVLFPLAARDTDRAAAAKGTLRRTFAVMAVAAMLMVPLALFAPMIIRLIFGPAFLESAAPLRYFIPGIIFLSGLLLVNNHVSGFGYPVFQLGAMAVALVCNILLNLLLLPRLGVNGASIASSLSYGFWLAMMLSYLYRTGYDRAVPVERS